MIEYAVNSSSRRQAALDDLGRFILEKSRRVPSSPHAWLERAEVRALLDFYRKRRPVNPPETERVEYRYLTRKVPTLQAVRSVVGGGDVRVVGLAHRFGEVFDMGDGLTERVEPGAFDRTLREEEQIVFNLNHNNDFAVADIAGGTLTLRATPRALMVEATIPTTAIGEHILSGIKRGTFASMSFAFSIRDQEFRPIGVDSLERIIRDVKLFDVSSVALPAYGGTSLVIADASGRSLPRWHDRSTDDVWDWDIPMRGTRFASDPESDALKAWVESL